MINMEYKILHSTLQVHGTSITRIKKSNKMKIHQSALAWDEIKLRWHYYAKPVMIWEPRFTDEKPEAITNFGPPTNTVFVITIVIINIDISRDSGWSNKVECHHRVYWGWLQLEHALLPPAATCSPHSSY